jgi:prolyl oligopeptidase
MTLVARFDTLTVSAYKKPVLGFGGGQPTSTVQKTLQMPAPMTAQALAFMGNVHFGASTKLPPTPKDPSIVEDLHDQQVADPYRPLENLDAPETVNWWKAQNERTQAFLSKADDIRKAATKWHEEIRNYTRESMQSEYGGNYFFSRQAGLDPQPTYYVCVGGKGAKPRVLLDPNKLSSDGTVAIQTMDVSPNGKLVAYTVSAAGSDWQTMRFKNVETGEDVYEELKGLRFTDATWDVDSKGVIYSKPLPDAEANGGKHFALFHHTLGEDPSNDVLIYNRPDGDFSYVSAFRLEKDDSVLFVAVYHGTGSDDGGIYFQKSGETKLTEVLPPHVASLSPFYRDGDTLYAVTDLNAPRGRIVAIDMNNPTGTTGKLLCRKVRTRQKR